MDGGRRPSLQLCFALLVLSGWAFHEGYGWRTKQEYVFRLEGRTVTSFLSLDTYGAGIHYLATLRVQAVSSSVLLLRVENPKYTKVQEEMPESWWKRFENPDDNYEQLPLTDTTVVINHEDGVVRSVAYSPELKEWEVNFLQGIAGHLQVNLARGGGLLAPELSNAHGKRRNPEIAIYKVVENGVAGRCEVLYEVAKESRAQAMLGSDWPDNTNACGGRSLLEITKTTNYSNCEHNAEYHTGVPPSAAGCNAGSSLCGEFWQRVFVTRMRGCGDQSDFMVLDSVSTSRQLANLHLHEDSGAAVNSYVNLSLVSTEQVDRFMPTVSRPNMQKNLVYLYRPQELEERSSRGRRAATRDEHRRRPKHHQVQRAKEPVRPDDASSEEEGSREPAAMPPPDAYNPQQLAYCPQFLARREPSVRQELVQDLRRMLREVAAEMDDPQQLQSKLTLGKLESALIVGRSLRLSELRAALGDVFESSGEHSDTERKLAMDWLVMFGTHPSFHVIKELVESEKISKESAADVIATVPHHISAPTVSLLDEFSSLLSSPAVKKDQQLLISTTLGFSNLVRAACASSKARRAYSTEVFQADACTSRAAERYLKQLVAVAKQYPGLQPVTLTALGNTGLSSALPIVAAVAAGDSSAYMRSVAVFSLRHHAILQPAATLPVLLGVFQRQENPVAVRMAAVALLFHASPQFAVYQRIAISTWYERDPALVAFVVSSLESFARTDYPGWENLKKNAQAALKLAKPTSIGVERAYNVIWSTVADNLNDIVLQQLEWIFNLKFSTLYYHSMSRLGGFPYLNFEAELDVTNPLGLLASLKELVAPSDDAALALPPLADLQRSTSDIAKALGAAVKVLPNAEGVLRFKTSHLAERMLPFGKKLPLELFKATKNLVSQMKQRKEFHFQKVDARMIMLETVNEMGFPVSFKVSAPTATRVSGEAKITEDNSHVAFDVSAFHAQYLVGELMVYTPWDDMLHLAGSRGSIVVTPPALRLNARLDASAGLLQLELKPSRKAPSVGGGGVHHSTTPYIAQRNARATSLEEPSKAIHVTRSKKQVLYRDRRLRMSYESDDPRDLLEQYQDTVAVLGFPVMADLRASSAELQFAEFPPVVATFGLGKATARKGEVKILSAAKEGREWPLDILERGREMETNMMRDEEEEEQYQQTTSQASSEQSQEEEGRMTPTEVTATDAPGWEDPADVTESWSSQFQEECEITKEESEDDNKGSDEEEEELSKLRWLAPRERTSFAAGGLDPYAPDVDGASYLLRETLGDFYYGQAFVVSANISVNSQNPSNYSAFLVHAVRPFSLERKIALFVKERTSNVDLKFGLYIRDPLKAIFNVKQFLLSNTSSVINSDVELQVKDTKYTATLWGDAVHRQATPSSILKSWKQEGCEAEECSEVPLFNKKCKDLLYRAATYDLLSATLTFNEEAMNILPEEDSWQSDAAEVLEPYLGEHTERRPREQGGSKYGASAFIAEDGRSLSLVFVTPSGSRIYRSVPSPVFPADRTAQLPQGDVFGEQSCIIGSNRISTYDGVEYEYGINNCWHVATMDCSGKNKVAILAKRNNGELELELNADNYKIISVLAGPRVLVNDEEMDLAESNVTHVEDDRRAVFAEVALGHDDSIRIDLLAYGLRVMYDKSAAVIQSTSYLDGRMCGLCGDQDKDLANEFTGPSGRTLPTALEFGRSYLLQDSDCAQEQPRQSPGVC